MKINFSKVDFAESAMAMAFLTSQQTGVRVIFRPANTASTDGKNIFIPPVKLKTEIEWKITEGFVLHESAHVKFTDFDVFATAPTRFFHSLLNIFEDCRIERELPKTLPGTAVKLEYLFREIILSKELTQEGMQGLAGIVNYVLSVARQILYPAQDVMPKIQRLRQALETQFSSYVLNETIVVCQKSVTAKSTQGCAKYAKQVFDLFKDAYEEEKKKQEEEQKQQQQNQQQSGSSQNNGSSSGQNSGSSQDASGNSSGASTSPSQDTAEGSSQKGVSSSGGNSDSEGDSKQNNSQQPNGSGQGSGSSQCASGQDTSQDAGDSSQNASGPGQASSVAVQDSPGSGFSKGFSPHGSSDLASSWEELIASLNEDAIQDYDKALKGFVGGLEQDADASNFNMPTVDDVKPAQLLHKDIYPYTQAFTVLRRAVIEETMKRKKPSTTGTRLNSRRLAKVASGLDQKAFLSKTPHMALDTYINILVDCSGSMRGEPIVTANFVLNGLRNALDTIQGIKLEVAGFSDSLSGGSAGVYPLSSSQRNVGFPSIGGTPVSEALNWARFKCLMASEPRKIIFLITDGSFDTTTREEVKAKVKRYKKVGVETVGIFLESSPCFLPVGFNIKSAAELPAALKSIWKNLLYPDSYQE